MKMFSILLAALLAGCLDDEPATVDDVIPRLTVVTPDTSRVADGKSPIEIEVCRADDPGIAKTASATLKTSAGTWQNSDADARTATVAMSMVCEKRLLVPPTEAGTLTVSATMDSFTRTLPLTLRMAPVERVRLARQGMLSSSAASTLTLTATLDTLGGGKPSVGTLVSFNVTVNEPTGGTAYFSEREARIVQGSAAQTMLYVMSGVTNLTVTACAAPAEQPMVCSDPLPVTP